MNSCIARYVPLTWNVYFLHNHHSKARIGNLRVIGVHLKAFARGLRRLLPAEVGILTARALTT